MKPRLIESQTGFLHGVFWINRINPIIVCLPYVNVSTARLQIWISLPYSTFNIR